MRSFAAKYPRLAALLSIFVLTLAVAAFFLIRAGIAPAADVPAQVPVASALAAEAPAQALADPAPTPEPLTSANCFAGVLADDPFHCRVLQGMHDDGAMTVEAMYESPSQVLVIYVAQSESQLPGITDEIWRRSQVEIRRLPVNPCSRLSKFGGCNGGVLNGRGDASGGKVLLPRMERYVNIYLRGGGSEARLGHPGWAALREIWPRPAGASGDAESGISVAGVDTTNFDPIDCSSVDVQVVDYLTICPYWAQYPNLNVAGWITDGARPWSVERHYVQVKPPSEAATDSFVADAKAELQNIYPPGEEYEVTVIPVKYSFDELLRWAIVLDRFSLAAGNTMAIHYALVGRNQQGFNDQTVFPLADQPSVHPDDEPLRSRTTIVVYTGDLRATAAALPELLPLLGIPVDAVGMVVKLKSTPFVPGVLE